MLNGIGAAPGVGLGRALVLTEQRLDYSGVQFAGADAEKQRLQTAAAEVQAELQAMAAALSQKVGEQAAEILNGQVMMLADPFVTGQMNDQISTGLCAEAAADAVCQSFAEMFAAMDDELMRQRATDVRDLRGRLLSRLLGKAQIELSNLAPGTVLVARDFTPSMTVGIDAKSVAGIITETGGRTSHSAILARALEIPAVLSLAGATSTIATGDELALDGDTGEVWLRPEDAMKAQLSKKQAQQAVQKGLLAKYLGRPTQTADGRRVQLFANIGTAAEAGAAEEKGAEGVGLFRTEFLFMDRPTMPTEAEQLAAYRQVSALFSHSEVIIRTLDVGGDKAIGYLNMPPEENPFLGHRAIRYCLANEALYLVQLRALLQAGALHKNIKIMLPLVTGVQEITAAKALLQTAKQQLAAEGRAFDENAQVGVMIETPAAAFTADLLAKEADFFSIGTNDLTQYTLAVDRGNPKVEGLYSHYHPAVLRAVRAVIEAAKAAHIPVGMCGEAAADPALVPLLLAWGLDEFSVNPAAVLATRRAVSLWSEAEASTLAGQALALPTAEAVQALLEQNAKK